MTYYSRSLVTAPAVEPISTADAKTHLRVTVSDDDDYIGSLVKAARQYVEVTCGRALITQTWDIFLDDWPDVDYFHLPLSPLQSVTSITYEDSDGNTSTFSSDDYRVDAASDPGSVVLDYGASWPSVTLAATNPITVRIVCGYGDAASDVPMPIIQAMLMLIRHWYDNRSSVLTGVGVAAIEVPIGAQFLLAPYRIQDLR